MTKKIILGTAQSISGYGVTNNNSNVDIQQLLDSYYIFGGRDLDTAPNYANAEEIIGINQNSFNVTTKIPLINDVSKDDYIKKAYVSIETSIKKLGLSTIDNLLIHDIASFIDNLMTL